MKGWKNLTLLFLTAALTPFQSFASETVGTVKVKFTVETGESYENGLPMIEGETNSTKYNIDEVTTLEEYMAQWEDDSGDDDDTHDRKDNSDLLAYNETYLAMEDYSQVVYAVLVDASDNYYFSSNTEKIKVSGLGAEFVRLERLNDKTTLVLFVRFSQLDSLAGTAGQVGWQDTGRASWSYSKDPAWYELRLYADGKARGGVKITGASAYDFRPLMQAGGSYSYKIRPIGADGTAGEWTESDSAVTVAADQAALFKELFALEAVTEPSGDEAGPPRITGYRNTGWQETGDGRYWYRETDGTYPQQNWLREEGLWYFFDPEGYMVRERYIKWGNDTYYMDSEGKMLTRGQAPDGRLAGENGALKWPDL